MGTPHLHLMRWGSNIIFHKTCLAAVEWGWQVLWNKPLFALGLTCVYVVPRDFLSLKMDPSTNTNWFSLTAKISFEGHNQNRQLCRFKTCMEFIWQILMELEMPQDFLQSSFEAPRGINANTRQPLKGPVVLRTRGLLWCSCYGRHNHCVIVAR